MFTLHNGDCLEYMKALQPSRKFILVTDPPYGISYRNSRKRKSTQPGRNRSNWKSVEWSPYLVGDKKPFEPEPFLYFYNVLLWGAQHFKDKLPDTGGWITWDKKQADGFSGKGIDRAWSSVLSGNRTFEYLWDGFRRAGEVGQHYHPTQKPIALMKFCIELVSNPGDVIFDPYMGSGTTGVAALQLGRDFIGCEIDPKYFAIAEKRLKLAVLQPSLFTPSNTACTRLGEGSRQNSLFSTDSTPVIGDESKPTPSG